MAAPSACVFWVLSLGSLAGGVVRGLTAFGSAIILILAWIMARFVGLDPGPLQLLVVCDCVSSVVSAIPLFVLTQAHKTADWRLASTLLVSQTAFAPLGVAMLVFMNKRVIELVLGVCLVVVIAMQTSCVSYLSLYCHCTYARIRGLHHLPCQCDAAQQLDDAHNDMDSPSEREGLLAASGGHGSPGPCASTQGCTCEQADKSTPRPLVIHVCAASAVSVDGAPALSLPVVGSSTLSLEHTPCISSTAVILSDNAERPHSFITAPGGGSRVISSTANSDLAAGGSVISHVCRRIHHFLSENKEMLLWGTAAGAVAGVMSGMTGMGGPPIMYLYTRLNVAKDTARGVGAVTSLFQFRIIPYLAMGILQRSDVPLYASATCASLLGLLVGTWLTSYVNQAAFRNILTSLICVCCILLFAAAAGFTNG